METSVPFYVLLVYLVFAALLTPINVIVAFILLYGINRYHRYFFLSKMNIAWDLFNYSGDPEKFGWRDVFRWAKMTLCHITLHCIGVAFRTKKFRNLAKNIYFSYYHDLYKRR